MLSPSKGLSSALLVPASVGGVPRLSFSESLQLSTDPRQVLRQDDAVRLTLSSNGRKGAPLPKAAEIDASLFSEASKEELRPKSGAQTLLENIGKVISEAKNLRIKQQETLMREGQRDAALQEEAGLDKEFEKLKSSKDFINLGNVISDALRSTTSGSSQTVFATSSEQSQLVGDPFLQLVESGASQEIGTLNTLMNDISNTSLADASVEALTSLERRIREAIKIFAGPAAYEDNAEESSVHNSANSTGGIKGVPSIESLVVTTLEQLNEDGESADKLHSLDSRRVNDLVNPND